MASLQYTGQTTHEQASKWGGLEKGVIPFIQLEKPLPLPVILMVTYFRVIYTPPPEFSGENADIETDTLTVISP